MEEQIRFFDDVDLNNAIIDLQVLGVCLRRAVLELPESTIKEYLLFKITDPVKLNTEIDFIKLQNRISKIIVALESLSGIEEVLRVLNEMKDLLKIITDYLNVRF